MRSKAHDIIAALVVRKMKELGFVPVSADTQEALFGENRLPVTVSLGRHRPDIIGYRKEDDKVCIGEAKTMSDLKAARTKEQIEDYVSLRSVELFLGIPSDGCQLLSDILNPLDLKENTSIHVIKVPAELLLSESYEKNGT